MRKILIPIAVLAAAVVVAIPVLSAGGDHATLRVRSGSLGHYVTDSRGFTLYLFEKDEHGRSACNGTCAKVWAPYVTSGKPSAGHGVSAAKLGTIKRRDGRLQVTYAGHPLYHYDDDHKAGQTEGQGASAFGAKWYVVAPSGKKIDND